MTRTQWAIIGVLATMVVILFCLLSIVLVGTIPGISLPQVSVPEVPTHTPFVPTPFRSPTSPAPTSPPRLVRLGEFGSSKGWICYPSYDHMWFEGTVYNDTARTVRFVRIRVTIFDDAGKIVNTNLGYTQSDKIAPGTSATFSTYVDNPHYAAKKCSAQIEDWQTE